MKGLPGRTIWVNIRPTSASAFCCESAPASVIGAIAPASVNGVTQTAWLRLDISMMPWLIGTSRVSGELVLMIVTRLGSASIWASVALRAIRTISIASMLRWRPSEYTWITLSVSVSRSNVASRWRTDPWMSTGSTG